MQEFFTWALLATYAGAVLATTLLTQLCKGLSFLKSMPTRFLSYLLALVILLLALLFTGELTIQSGLLSIVNAAVVSLASNGAFDAVTKRQKKG